MADLPFLSYQTSIEEAVKNGGRLLKEGGAQAVKLEGGLSMVPTIQRLVDSGIPVMGHIGLTPQAVNQLGGFAIQGRQAQDAKRIIEEAKAIEKAGAFSIVPGRNPLAAGKTCYRKPHHPHSGHWRWPQL